MKIKRLEINELDNFLKFHDQAYPDRLNIRERFKFQFLDNPLLLEKSNPYIFLAYNQDLEIIGQYGVNPSKYFYQEKIFPCFCGCDLFVYKDYRKYGVGGLLSIKAINSCSPHVSIGVSAEAYPLLISLNMKKIGDVFIFSWFRNINSFIRWGIKLLNKNKASTINLNEIKLPSSIIVGEYKFIINSEIENCNYNFNSVLEFYRDNNFLKWRFPKELGYYLYQKEGENKIYLVLKLMNWNRGLFLTIVDYNCKIEDSSTFEAIIKAAKQLVVKNKLDGILILSSHQFFDNKLKNEKFFRIGSPFGIFTNVHSEFSLKLIKQRKLAKITMADSDLEFAFWPKK